MRACWVLVLLVGCRFSHVTHSQGACDDHLRTVRVPVGGNVSVPCPKLTSEDMTFSLFKDQDVIYNQTCIHANNAPSCKSPLATVGVVLLENTENKSYSFTLVGVDPYGDGVYRCEGIVIYPPPLKRVQSDLRTVVFVEGHRYKVTKVHDDPKRDDGQKSEVPWIWILVLVPFVIYGVIVTIFALVFWVKMRKTDSQSDYMNTKPRASRDRRKKRGVQNPIPRHF